MGKTKTLNEVRMIIKGMSAEEIKNAMEENRKKFQESKKELYRKTYYSIMFAIDYAINELGDNAIRYDSVHQIDYLVKQMKSYYVKIKDEDAQISSMESPKSITNLISNLLKLDGDVTIDELYEMYEIAGKPKVNAFKVMKQVDSMWKVTFT